MSVGVWREAGEGEQKERGKMFHPSSSLKWILWMAHEVTAFPHLRLGCPVMQDARGESERTHGKLTQNAVTMVSG